MVAEVHAVDTVGADMAAEAAVAAAAMAEVVAADAEAVGVVAIAVTAEDTAAGAAEETANQDFVWMIERSRKGR